MSQKCWHKPSETKLVQKERKNLRKHLRSQKREKSNREKILGSKKIQKLLLSSVVSLVWFLVVVACAYFIRGKYILTTTLIANTHFSTRAFSERERERERKERVNNGNANASFVSTNDATKINATKRHHSKIIVEKENI